MTLMNYRSDPQILPAGEKHYRSLTLVVDPGPEQGRVEIQIPDASENEDQAWYTPEDGASFSTKGAFVIQRENTPPMRIVAFAGAKYAIFGQ